MSRQIQIRRGTTAENEAFTGAEGEVVFDTQKHELRVHDGSTQGGYVIPTKSYSYSKIELDSLLDNKANSAFSNTDLSDYVIESQLPSVQNSNTWYKKYKSGWVEQGGIVSVNVFANTDTAWSASLPISMSNTEYTVLCNPKSGWITSLKGGVETVTTTGISGYVNNANATTVYIYWQVIGISAS